MFLDPPLVPLPRPFNSRLRSFVRTRYPSHLAAPRTSVKPPKRPSVLAANDVVDCAAFFRICPLRSDLSPLPVGHTAKRIREEDCGLAGREEGWRGQVEEVLAQRRGTVAREQRRAAPEAGHKTQLRGRNGLKLTPVLSAQCGALCWSDGVQRARRLLLAFLLERLDHRSS